MAMEILSYAIEFVIQTGFLLLALWIMIKVQKMNYKFLGLIGSAALAIGLGMVLDRFVGVFFSTPLVCAVLLFCVAKATGTTRFFDTDVVFTVAVAFALTFCMNLFLLGALMGNLRPSAASDEQMEEALEKLATEFEAAATNQQMTVSLATNVPTTNTASPVAAADKSISTNTAKTAATAGVQKKPAPKKGTAQPKEPPSPVEITKGFSLKGVVRSSDKSMATIYTGTKTYMIGIGETLSMQSAKGVVDVRCEEVGESSALLSVAGEKVELFLQ